MADPIQIVGSFLSPYVRKVLACLEWKGLAYAVDPIVPFFGNERFTALSPLRRVPVMVDGELALADSSVICQYLEDRYPTPSFLGGPAWADRLVHRELDELGDTIADQAVAAFLSRGRDRPRPRDRAPARDSDPRGTGRSPTSP